MISPLLFTVYTDELLMNGMLHRQYLMRCCIICRRFITVDPNTVLCRHDIIIMISVCEALAREYHVIFNAAKGKLLVFPD